QTIYQLLLAHRLDKLVRERVVGFEFVEVVHEFPRLSDRKKDCSARAFGSKSPVHVSHRSLWPKKKTRAVAWAFEIECRAALTRGEARTLGSRHDLNMTHRLPTKQRAEPTRKQPPQIGRTPVRCSSTLLPYPSRNTSQPSCSTH